jgi:hypothetical protein
VARAEVQSQVSLDEPLRDKVWPPCGSSCVALIGGRLHGEDCGGSPCSNDLVGSRSSSAEKFEAVPAFPFASRGYPTTASNLPVEGRPPDGVGKSYDPGHWRRAGASSPTPTPGGSPGDDFGSVVDDMAAAGSGHGQCVASCGGIGALRERLWELAAATIFDARSTALARRVVTSWRIAAAREPSHKGIQICKRLGGATCPFLHDQRGQR